jgi:hypothetical protein
MLLEWESSRKWIKLELYIEEMTGTGTKTHFSCDSFCKAFMVCR